ncbi:hypothetical protein FE844_004500 [Rhizobium indicum]|uniref:hypothetical protein n=1 Tax=Rhizobium indicum TaxID=2583231 RepID=UPI001107428C|nr:hypothetical protein [Rhizobium indicum]QKK28879.1 hypothetical protein FE844_004500 [Rhizobium indicum]
MEIVLLKAFLITTTVMLIASDAFAEEQYTVGKAMESSDQKWLNDRITTIGNTLTWANDFAKDDGKPLFCPPPKLTIAGEQWRRLLDDMLNEKPSMRNEHISYLAPLLIFAAKRTFPCN